MPPAEAAVLPCAVAHFVDMNDAHADTFLVRDISRTLEFGSWRWANEKPTLRFWLEQHRGLKFSMDFVFPEEHFNERAPVTISYLVNGRLLEKVRYETPGDKHYEKAVPATLLRAGDFNEVTAAVDKPWVAPADGNKLGFILYRAGFIP